MASVLLRLAFVSLLPQALGLDCGGCYSTESWADCESKLQSAFCSNDTSLFLCQTREVTETKYGKTTIHYFKECGPPEHCNEASCDVWRDDTKYSCRVYCCRHDNCNVEANAVLLSRLSKMDRELTAMTKMMRKLMNEEKPKSRVICEHKNATITCKKGEKITIVKANYGRLNKTACTKSPILSTNCRAAKSLALVQSTCHKKASCVLLASNKVFGDPCKGIFKYLLVKYKCER